VENCGTLAYEIPGLKLRALLLWLFLAFWLWQKPKKHLFRSQKNRIFVYGFQNPKAKKPKKSHNKRALSRFGVKGICLLVLGCI
jgi:hypothetical protein